MNTLADIVVKATPGPWSVAAGCDQYVCSDGLWIASTMGVKGDEGAANARLIAAAPELFTALEDFDNWFCGFNPEDQASRMEGRKVVIRARAAIAKATGAA